MIISPRVRRLGNDIVACYLLITDEGVTVIDAGLAGHWKDLLKELSHAGRSLSDIRGLILTHGDSDHLGFAERLRRDHGVAVFIHSLDADRARGGVKPATPGQSWRPAATAGFFVYAVSKGAARTTWLTDLTPVHDGEVLDLPGAPRVIAVPGHSPGSIAVHSEVADTVFVGDALTTRHVLTGERRAQLAPFSDDEAQALSSLQRIADTHATWVLPGHGAPWDEGAQTLVAAITHRTRR